MRPAIRHRIFMTTSVVTAIGLFVFFMLGTRTGARLITHHAISSMVDADSAQWDRLTGTLARGTIYQNLLIQDLAAFPIPNRLEIQTLKVDLDWTRFWQIPDIEIENGKLTLPDADPVLFYGSLKDRNPDFNISSQSLRHEALQEIFSAMVTGDLEWELSGLDISLTGRIEIPVIQGNVIVTRLVYGDFQLLEIPCEFQLSFNPASKGWDPQGYLTLHSGSAHGPRTAEISLDKSHMFFEGDFQTPHLDITAEARVEKIRITIHVTGTPDAPELNLISTPPLARENLMLALATGQTWQRTEELLTQGTMTPQITRDFISYFLFGGRRNEFARRFGFKEMSLNYSETQRGLSMRKDLSDRLEGGYGVEQTIKSDGTSDVSQTIGGAYKITDQMSLEASRQVTSSMDPAKQEDPAVVNDKVLLKIQTPF